MTCFYANNLTFMCWVRKLSAALLLSSALPLSANEPAIAVKGLSVKGNSELPKVLYVVPWQASYGRFFDEEKELSETKGSFSYAEPEMDRKLRYFRNNLSVEIQPFTIY